MGSGHFCPGHIPLETLPRTIFPPVLHSIEHFPLPPPFAVLQYKACTKLIEVDRLGSARQVSAIFEILAMTAGKNVLGGLGD